MTREMVWVPPGRFSYHSHHRFREGGFMFYDQGPRQVNILGFHIDRYEVTNADFQEFLQITGYMPDDPHNFLRHWDEGFPTSLADHPVTWVSLEDARAFAKWEGKRLPSDIEWQWAAQGDDGRDYPWGDTFQADACNSDTAGTTPVTTFPANISPFGVGDLVGNVWEWIDVICSDGWHEWCFIRGGSYYKAKGSNWYSEGGAQKVNHHHKFLLLSPSLDRCGTVGFRCVKSDQATVQGIFE